MHMYAALGCFECIPASGSALVCSSWVFRVHTCFRFRSGMYLSGVSSAYLLPVPLWYAALGCFECIPASGSALVCTSRVFRVHTCFRFRSGMQLLGVSSAYLLPVPLWYVTLGCFECIPASGSALVCNSWVFRVHTCFRFQIGRASCRERV